MFSAPVRDWFSEGVDQISPRQQATADAFRVLKAADDDGDRAAIEDEIIRLNLGVAVDLARRYRNRGIPVEDLQQVASLGLLKAARRFDPDHGSDFLSYAVPTIRGELRRHFRDLGWMVRPPRSIQELQAKVTSVDAELHQRLGRSPRPSEIAEHLDVPRDHVVEALGAVGCFAPTSLDGAGPEDNGALTRLGSDDPGYARAEARVTLRSLVSGLDPRERRILEMRFVRGCTQAEIGSEIGVTQTQVSRQLSALLDRLRLRLDLETAV